MKCEINDFGYDNSKIINDLMVFYWLKNKIVTCRMMNSEKPFFSSDDERLIYVNGLEIYNERNKNDKVFLFDT